MYKYKCINIKINKTYKYHIDSELYQEETQESVHQSYM